jgi:hypothetical protein
MEVSGQLHAPATLPPGRALGTHWIGGWVGPRAILDEVVKRKIPSLHQESSITTLQLNVFMHKDYILKIIFYVNTLIYSIYNS